MLRPQIKDMECICLPELTELSLRIALGIPCNRPNYPPLAGTTCGEPLCARLTPSFHVCYILYCSAGLFLRFCPRTPCVLSYLVAFLDKLYLVLLYLGISIICPPFYFPF